MSLEKALISAAAILGGSITINYGLGTMQRVLHNRKLHSQLSAELQRMQESGASEEEILSLTNSYLGKLL